MEKISKRTWNLFKESPEGKQAIAKFRRLQDEYCTFDEMLNIAKEMDPQFFQNSKRKDMERFKTILLQVEEIISHLVESRAIENEDVDTAFVYSYVLYTMLKDNPDQEYQDIPQSYFKFALSCNLLTTLMLHAYFPSLFVPNFFVMQFLYLQKFAEKYDIELPEVPNRTDYFARNNYYLDINEILIEFAVANGFEDPAEFCAYLFCFEIPDIKERIADQPQAEMPDEPGQAWLLVGNYTEGEKGMEYGFWQANQLTSRGDIMLFYEKSPVKAMNSIWIAQEDGVIDPFFLYYSNTYIGNKIEIPADCAITFQEFKNNEYFKNRAKEGNFVSKNFQDCSGWKVTRDDYNEIKRMLEAKGFDTSVLPKLYEPKKIGNVIIEKEADVSEKLLLPLLDQMGFKGEYEAEVHFPAGRGETQSNKRPDFCLHVTRKNGDIQARVVIEVKKSMKNKEEIHDNFLQGQSYAKWGLAKVLVICDDRIIRVYQSNGEKGFNERKFIEYSWYDMENLDKYEELRTILK